MRKGVFHYRIILLSTEHDTHRRIIAGIHQMACIIVYVHLHLAKVLVSEGVYLQVNQYVAASRDVVEHKVYVEVLPVERDAFLPRHETIAASQFQQEVL